MRILLVLILFAISATDLAAHRVQVPELRLEEIGPRTYRIKYLVRIGDGIHQPPPLLPEHCRYLNRAETEQAPEGRVMLDFEAEGRPLAVGDQLKLEWNRDGVMATAIWRNGTTARQYVPADGDAITIDVGDLAAGSGTSWRRATRFLGLGFSHILEGVDHLLFVGGLLLLAGIGRKVFLVVTAFTAAHSLTLALSVFDVLRLSPEVVEPLIALSIAVLAAEVVLRHRGEETWVARHPWPVVFTFGLVHGLGFAGVLGEMGLSNESIPQALLFFNLGVELGQLLFLVVLAAVVLSLARLGFHSRHGERARITVAYAVGILAACWTVARLEWLWTGWPALS